MKNANHFLNGLRIILINSGIIRVGEVPTLIFYAADIIAENRRKITKCNKL